MDEADKLRSLKKAYAEIILNTAKEAASRIMVTERKALKFEQQLFATKEESLRMLLRIKQVMDAKITKAEIRSIGQQQLIEELEAQLHEAEDIVRDLRAELWEVQDELDRVAVRQRWKEPILKVFHATHEEEYLENGRNVSNSVICPEMDLEPEHVITYDVRDSPSNSRNAVNKCQIATESHIKNQCLGDPDFSALVMVNKDPELSRNGCTQRIRALERNLVVEKLSLSSAENERIVSKDAKGEGTDIEICRTNISSYETSSYPGIKNRPSVENCSKIIDIEDPKEAHSHWASRDIPHTTEISLRSGGVNGYLPLYDEVDGTTKEAIVREYEKGSHTKPVLGMDISCSLENELDEIKQVKQNKEFKVKEPKTLVILCRNLDNQIIEMSQASHPSPCKSSSLPDPVNDSVSLGVNPPTNIDTELPKYPKYCSVSSYPLYTAEMDTKLGCVKTNTHITLINEVELNKQEIGIGSIESSLARKTVLEMVKEPFKSDLQTFHVTTNETPVHAVNDRRIKYTFQRKRKKESLSSIDESSSFEDSVMKKNKMDDSHGSVVDSQKSSSESESSRHSLRLAQVALQVKLDVS